MKPRKPTELERRLLDLVRAVTDGEADYRGELWYRFAPVHPSAQVVSRAINRCDRLGWLRKGPFSSSQITAAGRKALKAGKVKP